MWKADQNSFGEVSLFARLAKKFVFAALMVEFRNKSVSGLSIFSQACSVLSSLARLKSFSFLLIALSESSVGKGELSLS